MKTKTIAFSIALAVGAASAASAQYQFDPSGAPVDMHIVDDQLNAFAAAGNASVLEAWRTAPFTIQEKKLFERASRPYDQGETD